MPLIQVSMATGRTPEQKERAAQAMTQALVEHCGAVAEHVYVVFTDVAPTDWVVGGVSVAERKRRRGETVDV